ncbi:hypothetical protein AVEN_207608-1 [Araneus ventricosus]|uniref:Mos1 transposase HTH domain-containing protein n=1 Tax=Araneus ventricosus TaxID=182803 RepID=A0A4Y2X4S9_ARAVE|nr:hypothetical protein AVEN_34805-1 [Araneus ventricosus]GBO43216.1 hypothetical protein AVEN_207608-1 [Araneus ventricosus]
MAWWYSQLHLRSYRFRRVVSAVRCMMDSSKSAQRAVIQFLRAEGEHASQIYRMMKEVYGKQCLARCTIFRWCQRYEAGRVNIKDSPRPGQAHVVTNSITISAVDELIRQNVGSPNVKLLLNCG